ncbi:tyrosine-type recombinase/integrase [Bradyrhizobium sp. 144]|uniref:tyrosine-type recombinase/integrase n=1 Tax=Bradyrhizobium sp. 144 TaxID=2782620 RepID=UPI001FFB4FBE|nr:tyrosine-type recombinase/integrase [Bradyrhizobium sp. 144]MCK1693100.1 tyrosine-type recombinase/integrase [Bradyrhizobium sp. 144]
MIVRLRYIHSFVDRHGKRRFYFRRRGKQTPLPGRPGDPDFMQAYYRAREGADTAPVIVLRRDHPPGSIGALVGSYKNSLEFKQNKPRTQHVTQLILERFANKYGDRLVRQMQRNHVEKILAQMASTPAAANDLLKKLRRLMAHARKEGWRIDDPCLGIRPFKSGTHHTWTDTEIKMFEQTWPIGTKERTAFALHLWTAQRSQDIRTMTWADLTAEGIRVVQGKTGEKLLIPVHAELRKVLKAYPREQHVIVATAFGRPFSEKGYGQWFAKAIERAGLPPRCVPHGLRKAGARRLAEHGASANEIAAITGHRTLKEVSRYTAAADQQRLAKAAMARLRERKQKQSGKPPLKGCQTTAKSQ